MYTRIYMYMCVEYLLHTTHVYLYLFSAIVPRLTIAADDVAHVYNVNGHHVLTSSSGQAQTVTLQSGTCVLAMLVQNSYGQAGLLAETSTGVVTDASWKCSRTYGHYWHHPSFDDSSWPNARVVATNGDGTFTTILDISAQAKWIWIDVTPTLGSIYCRKTLC